MTGKTAGLQDQNGFETHLAGAADKGLRLDVFLCGKTDIYPSKKAAYKAVKRGEIKVNARFVFDPQHSLQAGDRVTILPDSRPIPPPLCLSLNVIYEDDWLALVIKPPGLPVAGNFVKTALRALPFNLRASTALDCLRTPQTVHRLDSPTGGLLLAAKTASALADLGRQFENRAVRKIYHAVTAGNIPDQITVDQPLDDKQARTEFQVLASVPSLNYGQLCLVECRPVSGRMHQIRRHLASLGRPIVGDLQYGEKGHVLKGKGLFLWAIGIAFRHPFSGESMDITVETPAKFAHLMAREARRTERLRR